MAQNIVTQSAGTALPRQLQRSWRKAFQERTQGMAPERWRCVGIDIRKYEHVAVLQDEQGRILAGPLRFGISQAEMERFHTWLSPWVSGKDVELFIGMEPHAAEILGIGKSGLNQKIKRYNLDVGAKR